MSLSAFIYLSHFGITNVFLHTIFALLGFWLLLNLSKPQYFFTGFFIGLLWFYWIGFSFRFYDLTWALPFVILGLGLIYGILFLIPSLFTTSPYIRAFALLLLSQIEPFSFNWFNFELIFYYTPFGLSPIHLACIFISILILQNLKKVFWPLSLIFLILSLDFTNKTAPQPLPFELTLVQTKISQDVKWNESFMIETVNGNFRKIEDAISQNKRLIIFPETSFPMYLNINKAVVQRLQEYSQDIAIIAGSLAYDNAKPYNSAYFFDKGEMQRADKVVLVPFGEEIPLPDFMAKIINKVIFGGGSDFVRAKEPSDFIIDGIKIRSAVCYEGSTKALYKDSPQYMSVLSNNAWFLPSTQPTFQRLMLSLYSTKNNTIIYHSVNGEDGGIISPRKSALAPLLSWAGGLF